MCWVFKTTLLVFGGLPCSFIFLPLQHAGHEGTHSIKLTNRVYSSVDTRSGLGMNNKQYHEGWCAYATIMYGGASARQA